MDRLPPNHPLNPMRDPLGLIQELREDRERERDRHMLRLSIALAGIAVVLLLILAWVT